MPETYMLLKISQYLLAFTYYDVMINSVQTRS